MSLKPLGRNLIGDPWGATGLETAVILIAFAVVASVFAFTVLSAGIFSAGRGREISHPSLEDASSSLRLVGPVIVTGVADKILSRADSVWSSASPTIVTSTTDASDEKEGARLVIGAGFTTGLAAYENLSSAVDLSGNDSIQLWARSSVDTRAGDIELVLDDTAACGSPLESIGLLPLVAGAWTLATIPISDSSDMTALRCVGLNIATDKGPQTINLDGISARGQVASMVVTLANTPQGEPVDLTDPSDTDRDGLSDADSNHKLVVTYSDSGQTVEDVYWTRTFIGENDGDDLLENGEKAEVAVTLKGLAKASPVVKDTEFQLELRPGDGGVLVIERTVPASIGAVMNLD